MLQAEADAKEKALSTPLPDPLEAAVEAAKKAKAEGGGPAAVALAVKKVRRRLERHVVVGEWCGT